MFQSLLTEDLCWDLWQLMMIQRAIINVLCLVEGTALEVMNIFVMCEAEWEQMQEDLGLDNVVDARHRVDSVENFDYNSNLDL